ncbi:MAG: hypothetical protein L3K13_04280 [Thermoplasmata archaeon]|nr:hypothetical protein [Thermoplasmata archaeon]
MVEELGRMVRDNGRGASGRGTAWATVVATLAVTLLLLFPTSAAGKTGPLVLHKPPFKGTQLFDELTHAHGCGASASFPVYPFFNMTTGIGRVTLQSKTTSCGLPHYGDDAIVEAQIGFIGTSIVAKGSWQNYTMNSSFGFSWNLSATPALPGRGPSAWASDWYEFHAGLIDLDNGSKALGGCFTGFTGNTTNSSTTAKVTGSFSWSCGGPKWIAPVIKGHHVAVEFRIQFFTFAHATSGSNTRASAVLNMGTLGHRLVVLSWSFV